VIQAGPPRRPRGPGPWTDETDTTEKTTMAAKKSKKGKKSRKGKAKRSAKQIAAAKRNIKKAQAARKKGARKGSSKKGARKGKAKRSAKQKAAARRNIKKAQAARKKGGRKGKRSSKKGGAKKGGRKSKGKSKGRSTKRSKSAPRGASAHQISTLRGEVQDIAKVVHSHNGKIKDLEHDNANHYQFTKGVVNDVREVRGLAPLKSLPGYKLPGHGGSTGGSFAAGTRVLRPGLAGWNG
jgi:hypothetical protein